MFPESQATLKPNGLLYHSKEFVYLEVYTALQRRRPSSTALPL
jgi:hypothetical protein